VLSPVPFYSPVLSPVPFLWNFSPVLFACALSPVPC